MKWTKAFRTAYMKKWRQDNRLKTRDYERKARRDNPVSKMVQNAKYRARAAGMPFNLVPEDVVIPTHSPALGIPLRVGGASLDDSPSLDRLIPELGYVRGNVTVISYRANRIKNNSTLEELKLIASWVERQET